MIFISIGLNIALICLTLLAMARVDSAMRRLRRAAKGEEGAHAGKSDPDCASGNLISQLTPAASPKGGALGEDAAAPVLRAAEISPRDIAALLAYSGRAKNKTQEER